MKEITLEDAKKYMIGHIVYLDKKPRNFVVLFFNMGDKTLPAVKVVVKYDGAICSTAKVSSVGDLEVPISEAGTTKFKDKATKTVSLLCCNCKGRG